MIIRQILRRSFVVPCSVRPACRVARIHRPVPLPRFFATPVQHFSGKSSVDEKIEEIQELYATAKDEFEIASEGTDGKTVYAADDRAAAVEELGNLKKVYEEAIQGIGGDEIKRRIGQRIRELDQAVVAMGERAMED